MGTDAPLPPPRAWLPVVTAVLARPRLWFVAVRQVFVGHHDLLTRLATGGPQDAADAGGVERLNQLLEGETILAYTTGWLGRWRFQRSLYGELEVSRTRLPWTRRRVWSLLTGAASLILWLVVLDAFVKLVLVELPSS